MIYSAVFNWQGNFCEIWGGYAFLGLFVSDSMKQTCWNWLIRLAACNNDTKTLHEHGDNNVISSNCVAFLSA